mgnify:FL=1|jgi:hypothetical protein
MSKVTDEKLKNKILQEFNKQEINTDNFKKVTDPELVSKILEAQKDKEEKGFFEGVGETVKDFFTGTKKTEFADLPEIGEYKGVGAGKVALGLSITPNQKSQLDIILSQVPGSNAMEDKFGNLIVVMPDGKSFYLNKPGASFQDFAQTTSQILMYIPGYSSIAKKYANNLIKRSLAQVGQATAVTSGQEIVSEALGGDFDQGRVGITAGITGTFEAVLGPLGRAALKVIKGKPNYYKLISEKKPDGTTTRRIEITPQGYKALEAAGIDVKKLDPDFAKNFFNNVAKGFDDEVAAVAAGTGSKFGFELSRSQAKRDIEGIAALYEAAKGSYGRESQEVALNFLKKQEIDISLGLRELTKKLNQGNLTEEGLEDVGQSLINAIESKFKKASERVESAYNLIDKDALYNGNASNIKVLLNSVKKSVRNETGAPPNFLKAVDESTGVLDKELTPAALKSFNEIKKFVNSFNNKKSSKKIPPKTLGDFENMRKKLISYINAAKNDTDKKTAIAIKNEFDKLYDDTLDNLLFAGRNGDEILKKNIKNARKFYRDRELTFGVNTIKKGPVKINDPAGNAIQKILIDPDVTGMKAIDYIYGLGTVGRSKTATNIIKRLKKVFDVENLEPNVAAQKSRDFATLRSGMIEKMFNDSIRNAKFNPNALVKNFDYIFEKNPDFAKQLFGAGEIKILKEFVEEVRKTLKPNDLVNMSNTAAGISRIFQRGARQLVGIIGFKLASIQGLLLGRSAFDNAKDVFEQRAAKKLISNEFGQPPGWLKTMNETTGTGKNLAATVAIVNQTLGQTVPPLSVDAPKTSQEFIDKIKPLEIDLGGFRIPQVGTIGDQSSLPQTPNINPNLFAQAPTGIMQNLSRTEQALLSPSEQIIASRT